MASREAIVEEELYHLIRTVLKKHNYKLSGVEFRDVQPQYKVDGERADLVLRLADGTHILEIECKRKLEKPTGFRAIRDFDPLGSRVINQALGYAVKIGSHAFATTNGERLALFRAPEAGEPFRLDTHRLLVKEIKLEEKNVEEILTFVAQWYARVPVRLIDVDWLFISRLRSFVYFLSKNLKTVVKKLEKDEAFLNILMEFEEKVGSISTDQLAREAAYILMNKLVFYKILERHYKDLPKLKSIAAPDGAAFVEFLKAYFKKAIEVTKDFEPVFITGLYDAIPLPDLDYIFDEVNSFIEDMDTYRLEEVGSDVVGYIYEELIPDEERHRLGQFYTPPPIAELIVKWAVRDSNDVIMDPAVGSGTFLVKAYKRLAEIKLENYRKKGIKRKPKGLHREILSQLFADDINPFPAHLTAMNLAMRDVRYPTSEMNVIVEDFFNLKPRQKVLMSYAVKTPAGEIQRQVLIPKADAVMANPPYTRWVEIAEKTREGITDVIGKELKEYGLTGGIGKETGIYVHFIMYAHDFLKKNGKLGMIISNSWLQSDYGLNFANFLLDKFKVKAVIDFNQRLFRIPLIATCILLLEKEDDVKARNENRTVFLYVDEEAKVEEILDALENPEGWKERFLINAVKQGALPRNEKWIKIMFGVDATEKAMQISRLIFKAENLFEFRYGNVLGVSTRGGTGSDAFFYLTTDEAEKWGLTPHYVYPMIVSPRYSKYFTFRKKDWEKLKDEDKRCYIFMANKPLHKLPENVRKYIEWGEKTPLVKPKKRGAKLKTADRSLASSVRAKDKKNFYGWYDLRDVIPVQISVVRRAWYKARFILTDFPIALDEGAFISFLPKHDIRFTEKQIKALLAYLNSTFGQLFVEVLGISAGGGAAGLDVRTASELPLFDVRKLKTKKIEELAELFDKLESEARKLGGVEKKENLEKIQPIIAEIDEKIANTLSLDTKTIKTVATLSKILGERRLVRARRARPEAVRGEEEPKIRPPEKKQRKKVKEEPSIPLTKWMPLSKTETK